MAISSSGNTASAAVPTSIASTPCIGSASIANAPSGGPTMLTTPCSVWLKPETRAKCSLGTISEVEACIAGQWNAPPSERMNRIT